MRPTKLFVVLTLSLATLRCGEPSEEVGAERLRVADATSRVADEGAAHDGPLTLARGAEGSWVSDGGPQNLAACQQDLAKGRYVSCKADGTLAYPVDKNTGATVLDFSAVGYHGGELPLPELPVHQHLAPSGKDDTAQLQAAINAVSARPADSRGFRGRIVLAPGLFRVNRTLLVAKSGVAIEGTASLGPKVTTIKLTGSATTLFYVRGSGTAKVLDAVHAIVGLPVPAGAATLSVDNTDGLKIGDLVRITSTRNKQWISKMWGGIYPPERDGKQQPAWGERMDLQMPRTIVAIVGNTLTLDAPLPDAVPAADEAQAAGATVQKLDTSAYLREFGFAHLRLSGRFVPAAVGSPKLLTAIAVENAEDGYIDDIEATDFGASTVSLGAWTRHITVQDVRTVRTDVQEGSAKPFDISLRGQLNLVQGCASSGNKTFYVATHTTDAAGPNVVQNYRAEGAGTFEPHQRWSTGLLLDNIYVPFGGLALIDRGSAGSGHGWSMGYGVAYNSLAGTHNESKAGMNSKPGHTIDQPPSAANYGMGLVGPNQSAKPDDVHFDSPGKPVAPASLWVHQLWQHGGAAALQQVVGPWHLRSSDSEDNCLAVDVVKPGAFVVVRSCHDSRQRALWDITSRGSLRLGGTDLCLDADSDRRKTAVKVRPCVDDDEQHWSVAERGGAPTQVSLQSGDGEEDACLQRDGKLAVVGSCGQDAKDWKLVSTHLAR